MFDVVVASVLDAIGVTMDMKEDLNMDSMCDVNWRFVFPIGDSRFFPTKALKELLSRGVIHINPGSKMGAVDQVLVDAMDQLCNTHTHDSILQKQKRIVVIITSDRNYSGPVRRLKQCGLRTVLIHIPSKYLQNFPAMMPLDHALSIWDDIVDDTEMDATDLHHFAQRLSFRMQPRPGDSPSEKDDHDEQQEENEPEKLKSASDDKVPDALAATIIPEEEHIPDFKFGCAKDLYLFLLDRQNFEIETHQLHLFWEHYPQHHHEIGRIRNFCMSAKAEGAFNCAENTSGSSTLSIVPPHLRKKPLLVLSPGGHSGKGKKQAKKRGSKLATHMHAHVRRAHQGSAGGGVQSPGSTPRSTKLLSDKSDKDSGSEQSREVKKSHRGQDAATSAAATAAAHAALYSRSDGNHRSWLFLNVSETAFVLCAILTFVAVAYSYLYKDEALWTALSHVTLASEALQRARSWWLTNDIVIPATQIDPQSFLKYLPNPTFAPVISFFQSWNVSSSWW